MKRTELKRDNKVLPGVMCCAATVPSLCHRTAAQIAPFPGSSGASPLAGNLFFFFLSFVFFPTLLSLLTIVKPLRCRLMRLAGYICLTTEEVACGVTRSRPPQKSSPPSFPATSTDSLQDSETGRHLCGDRRAAIMLLIFILQGTNIRDLETPKALE